MTGVVWGVIWAVMVGGGAIGWQVRSALKTRHERRLELAELEVAAATARNRSLE